MTKSCAHCATPFRSKHNHARSRYCSLKCAGAAQTANAQIKRLSPDRAASLISEFVERRGLDDCWPWRGIVQPNGYGRACAVMGRKHEYAHRLAYAVAHPDQSIRGRFVLHSCDNPICCNPNHLSLGDHSENLRQAMERDRIARGPKAGGARLTPDMVSEIRASRAPHTHLAAEYGVHETTILRVRRGETWRSKGGSSGPLGWQQDQRPEQHHPQPHGASPWF